MLMDIAEIKRLIDEGKIEYVKIGASDIEGVFRGKRVAAKYFLNALDDGFPQCDVLFGWDIAENVLPNLKVSNWERGFADIVMKPDLSTFAMVPWEEKIASCICDLWTEHGEPVTVSPRYVMSQVMERARDNGLLIGRGGLLGNVLRLSPMLNISKADVDEGVRLLDKAFSEVRN